jgi:hypothetical protein
MNQQFNAPQSPNPMWPAFDAIARAIGLMGAFLFTPPFHHYSAWIVQALCSRIGGPDTTGLASVIWFCLLGYLSYAIGRAAVLAALLICFTGWLMRMALVA